MSDHFIGLNRGKTGATFSDFVTGAATGATDIEVRIADAPGWTRKEVDLALEAIKNALLDNGLIINFPPL